MSPELLAAIATVLAAVLGPAGIAALRRRNPESGPAAEVRDAAPAVASLAASLARSDERADALEARVDALEGQVWRCPAPACPVRDQLRREGVR